MFDTSVMVSGVGWRGKPYQCLELARSGTVDGVTCKELLEELSGILQTKLGFSDTQIAATMADLLSYLKVVAISGTLKVIHDDPADDKVIECAARAAATHIVTGDHRHLLSLGRFENIRIVTAAEFLQMVAAL